MQTQFIKSKLNFFSVGLIFLVSIISVLSGGILKASASEVKFEPKVQETSSGRVFYDTANLYTMRGTRNGAPWSDVTASLAVQYPDGHNDMVFCKQPGVPLTGGMWTDGYTGVESDNVSRRAQIASCIWQYVFPNKTQHEEITARAVFWNNLPEYNLDITSIDQIPEYPQLRAKLDKAIDDYEKKPSFHQQTIKLTYGQTTRLDAGTTDLNLFDNVYANTANVDFKVSNDGTYANVTPTDMNASSGIYRAKRSYMEGTPIVWTKPGSQTVVTPRIKDPNHYEVQFEIDTKGDIEIGKVDKDSNAYLADTKFKVEFSGENAPATKTVTTGSNGKVKVTGIPNGVKYKVTEIGVPKPYVLASAIGESDTYEGVVKAGGTSVVTARNVKATGQIVIEKSGVESGKETWNENYSRAGNVFEIREKDKDGKVVETITSNDQGVATSSNKLPLGTYYVSEKTAAIGFANTFKPVTVKVEYKDQKTAVVRVDDKGT
ncbi:MSCRAMM family protein, partial [Enterococcus sp. AZ163]|uniref:MSCRAMM family protein n=1 Tax=Enterococcus sp. AZ163 TaxID=2774638 RepID=UPI003D2C4610